MPSDHPALFANAPTRRSPVPAADPHPDDLSAASKLPAHVRLGTSSWSFPGWRGLVYDTAAQDKHLSEWGLAAYGQHPLLRAVGVDRTYYAPMETSAMAHWAAQVPSDFRFLVKAHDALTTAKWPKHPRYGALAGQENPRFLAPVTAESEVVRPIVEAFGDKLGVLLLQFPPQAEGDPRRFAERLYRFLSALPVGPRYAVEVRNPGWLTADYAQALQAAGACHCYNAIGTMPTIREQMKLVPGGARNGLVIRWMLARTMNYEQAKDSFAPFDRVVAPDDATRDDIAHLVGLATKRELETIVIANNKAEGCSPLSLRRLATALVAGG